MDVDQRPSEVWVAGDGGEAWGCGGSRDGVGGERKVGTRDEGAELSSRDGGGEIENEEEEEGVFMDADMGRRQDVKEEVVDGAKIMEGGVRAGDDDVEGKMDSYLSTSSIYFLGDFMQIVETSRSSIQASQDLHYCLLDIQKFLREGTT